MEFLVSCFGARRKSCKTPNGELKARIDSARGVKTGEKVGLGFEAPKITLFDESTGRALVSALNEGVLAHG